MSIAERITTGNTRTDLVFGYVIAGAMFAVSGPVWGGAAAILNTALVVLYATGACRNRADTQDCLDSDLWTCPACHAAHVDVIGDPTCTHCGDELLYYGEVEWAPAEVLTDGDWGSEADAR